jgi:Ca2+-binding EF-hand superfamily protein
MSNFELNKEEFENIIDSFKLCAKEGRITEEQFRTVLHNVVGERAKELNLEKWWKFFEMHCNDKTADYNEVVMGLAVYYKGSLVDSLLLQVYLTNYALS